jgi:hypothetical protein
MFSFSLLAEETSSKSLFGKGRSFLLGYSKNYPISISKEKFAPSVYHPIIGMRYYSENWVLGISSQFKMLKNRSNDSKEAYWTLEEEFNYRLRLYHPLYLLIGGKTLFIYPVRAGKIPFKKREDSNSEIGVGATMSFLCLFENGSGIGVFGNVWRGTGSRKYEAREFGVHLMFPFPS